MRKEITLHIGMGKTGTTALQKFFWRNRKRLEKAGICYPVYGSVAHAHHLLSPFIPKALESEWSFVPVSEWLPKLQKIRDKRILLSSELIAWSTHDQVIDFCQQVKKGFDLRIAIYVRRQDNMIIANYNQLVKAGTQREEIDKVWEKDLDRFNYKNIISSWTECLGKSRVIVRPYEKQQLYGGDIRRDFMHYAFEYDIPNDYEMVSDNSNPGLSSLAIAYKLHLNRLFPGKHQLTKFNAPLLSYAAQNRSSGDGIFVDQPVLPPSVRRSIVERSSAGNEYVARQYLGRSDGKLFMSPLPDDNEDWEPPRLESEDAWDITRHIEMTDVRLVRVLYQGIINGLASTDPLQRSSAAFLKHLVPPTFLAGLEGSGQRSIIKWRYVPEQKKQNSVPLMIVSLHFPLVPDDRFLDEVKNRLGSVVIQDDLDRPFHSGAYARHAQSMRSSVNMSKRLYTNYKMVCVHGNFMPLKYRYLQTNLRKRYVTWISHPVDRLVEHYEFWKGNLNLKYASYLRRRMLDEDWSFERFAFCPELKNFYSKYFWGFSPKHFDFIGIAEFPESEIQRFTSCVIDNTRDVPRIDVQETQSTPASLHLLGADLLQRIERYHGLDTGLYRRALAARGAWFTHANRKSLAAADNILSP